MISTLVAPHNAPFSTYKAPGEASFRKLLKDGEHREIAAHAVAIEVRTNLIR